MSLIRMGRFLVVLAGLGSGIAASAELAQGSGPVTPGDAHGQWALIETYCFKCHNAEDWAGKIAFDTMSAAEVPQDSKVWEAAIKKLRSGLMPPPNEKQPDRAAMLSTVNWLETTLDKAQEAAPYTGYVPLRRLNRREYANAVRDMLGLQIDAAAWLPQDQLKDDFDTNAELLQMNPSFMDQAVTASRSLALLAVGDPKSVPLETAYGLVPNMILSLAAAPAIGSGNQRRYKDGMPFGTRGGMVVAARLPGRRRVRAHDRRHGARARSAAHGVREYRHRAARWRGVLPHEHRRRGRSQGDRPDARSRGRAQINNRLRKIRFHATAGQHKLAVTFLHRSFAESDAAHAIPGRRSPHRRSARGWQRTNSGRARASRSAARSPVTGMSESASRAKIFICQADNEVPARSCATEIVGGEPRRARVPPAARAGGLERADGVLRCGQPRRAASRPACAMRYPRSSRARASSIARNRGRVGMRSR